MNKQNSRPKKAANYKGKRQRMLEICIISSLIMLSALFYSFKKFDNTGKIIIPKPPTITVENIPITKPPIKINRPTLPPIPVASEDEEICKDIPIDFGEVNIEELLAYSGPPSGDEEEIYEFINVQVKPEIIEMIQPYYPELARKTGTSGIVVIRVLIDKQGDVEKTEITKSIPLLDEAALDAAKKSKFKPAMQRDKYVKVWMAIPFHFKLK